MHYLFSDFEFDSLELELRRRGHRIRVRPQATALLSHLLRHRFRIVSRVEIERQIWPATSVSPSSFSTLLGELRAALGDSGRAQRIIRTLPGRGIRLAADVALRRDPQPPTPKRAAGSDAGSLFVGRHALLAAAEHALGRARHAEPAHLFLCGVIGSGKTRLLEEIAGLAWTRKLRPHFARSEPAAPEFWLWSQLLRSLAEEHASESWSALESIDAPVIRSLLRCEGASGCMGSDLIARQARFHYVDAISRFVLRWARREPTLLLLDDLHWADELSLLALHHLLAAGRQPPLCIIASYRPCPPGSRPDRGGPIRSLAGLPGIHSLPLPPLCVAEVEQLLAPSGSAHTRASAAARLRARSGGGNPLLLWECLDTAPSRTAAASVSSRLRISLSAEMERLPEGGRRLLEFAARHNCLDPRAQSQATGLPEARARALLESAAAIGLLTPARAAGRDHYRFRCSAWRRAIVACAEETTSGHSRPLTRSPQASD